MELIGLTTRQMVIMLQYMLTGIVLYRLNVLTPAGSRDLASVLIKLVIPAVLVKSFCITFSVRSCKTLGAGTLCSAITIWCMCGAAAVDSHIEHPRGKVIAV